MNEAASKPTASVTDLSTRTGVRLGEFQLLNWGTFDGSVARFPIDGQNALLTGQVGAGKSTIVDAMTTLFAASNRITFNRAAGAETRERTVASYVLGHHRNVVDDTTGTQRPEALRVSKSAYTVLLARFDGVPNTLTGTFTAGVVYTFTDASAGPKPLYLTAPGTLDIAKHLVGHTSIKDVRNALRSHGAALEDGFAPYAKNLCRALGTTPAALRLLVQTISLKQVGNLTDFVRSHMLDAGPVEDHIEQILAHYADLVRSHEVVQTARQQLDRLGPVKEHTQRFDRAEDRIGVTTAAYASVPLLTARHQVRLLEVELSALATQIPALDADVARIEARLEQLENERVQLEIAIASQGGAELTEAEHMIKDAHAQLTKATAAAVELGTLATTAGVSAPEGRDDHPRFATEVEHKIVALADELTQLQSRTFEAHTARQAARAEVEDLRKELRQAQLRPSNVPPDEVAVRDRVAAGCGINPEDLPYVAELVAVAPGRERWELAAERLVRPFALSMLVAHEHYARVSGWVDANNLRGRLTYYPVPADVAAARPPAGGTLAASLSVRPQHRMTRWVEAELTRRYPHVCAEDADAMREHLRAVTVAGQVKDRDRHFKDDRNADKGSRHYVLGWDTAARRRRLAEALKQKEPLLAGHDEALGTLARAATSLGNQQYAARQLTERFADAKVVDVAAAVSAVGDAEQLLNDLRAMATDLDALLKRRGRTTTSIDDLKKRQSKVVERRGAAKNQRTRYENELTTAQAAGATQNDTALVADAQSALDEALVVAGAEPGTLAAVSDWSAAVTAELQRRIDSSRATRERSGRDLVAAMKDFALLWPNDVVDLDPSDIASRAGFEALRRRLLDDDLPKFEKTFRHQLQTNALHELVAFAKFLDREERSIQSRIATINTALSGIDYQPGTFIRLEPEAATDPLVREFRAQLRHITTDVLLGDDDAYTEARFLVVKELLDRFAGREGFTTVDKTWTARVTDVRNWFTFAAAERLRSDPAVLVEHYADSGGKSGGQKEKLAYTVLAAALSYQYGLAAGNVNAFRFVMIDEAFGRGSDESTKFGLELFERLGLQLMVVTPLQKIDAIEPHVRAVGYVRMGNPRSRLISLTIEELKERRAARRRRSHDNHDDHDIDLDQEPFEEIV